MPRFSDARSAFAEEAFERGLRLADGGGIGGRVGARPGLEVIAEVGRGLVAHLLGRRLATMLGAARIVLHTQPTDVQFGTALRALITAQQRQTQGGKRRTAFPTDKIVGHRRVLQGTLAQEFVEHASGVRARLSACDFCGCAGDNDAAAALSGLRAHVEDPVRLGHDVKIVLDDDGRIAGGDKPMQDPQKLLHVRHVQSYGGLIENIQRMPLLVVDRSPYVAAHFRKLRDELDTLCFPAGKRRALLT